MKKEERGAVQTVRIVAIILACMGEILCELGAGMV